MKSTVESEKKMPAVIAQNASSKLEKQPSLESQEPIKQVPILIEKKIRNLEKRKGKLDTLREREANGEKLLVDQEKAVSKYVDVVEMLDFFKDFLKTVNSCFQDHSKWLSKQAKKEENARKLHDLELLRTAMVYQTVLNALNKEHVRQDFLKGTKSGVQLTEESLSKLSAILKLISPELNSTSKTTLPKQIEQSSLILRNLVEGHKGEIQLPEPLKATHKEIKELIMTVYGCGYFNQEPKPVEESSDNLGVEAGDQVAVGALNEQQSNIHQQQQHARQIPSHQQQQLDYTHQNKTRRSRGPANEPTPHGQQIHSQPQHAGATVGGFVFLQESRLEMSDPAVIAAMPAQYIPQYGSGIDVQGVDSLAAQLASSSMVPPGKQFDSSPAAVAAGVSHQPIPTQTFTNQNFAAMMSGGPAHGYVPAQHASMHLHGLQAVQSPHFQQPQQQQNVSPHHVGVAGQQTGSEHLIQQQQQVTDQHQQHNQPTTQQMHQDSSAFGNQSRDFHHQTGQQRHQDSRSGHNRSDKPHYGGGHHHNEDSGHSGFGGRGGYRGRSDRGGRGGGQGRGSFGGMNGYRGRGQPRGGGAPGGPRVGGGQH